jgi:predicted nucleotidyltransferase
MTRARQATDLTSTPEAIWPEPPPLTRARLVATLRRRLRGRAQEAYLFGSYARGEAHAESDIDLIVVADTTRAFLDRFRDLAGLGAGLPPIDLLVYTPAEWRGLRRAPPPLMRVARREWIPLQV